MNRSPVRRKRDLRRQVRAVFFGPDDLDRGRGDPSHRRTVPGRGASSRSGRSKEVAPHRLRPRAPPAQPAAEGVGPARACPPASRPGTRSSSRPGAAVIRARAEAIERLAPHASEEFVRLAGYELACDVRARTSGSATDDLEEAFRARIAERRARRARSGAPRSSGRTATTSTLAVRDLGARGFAIARRGVGGRALPARSASPPRWRRDRRAAGAAGRRPVQRARSRAGATRSGSTSPARGGQVVISVADEADVPARRTPCGTCTPAP